MDEDVRKELDDLKMMIIAWKESYLELARERGGGEFWVSEYSSEIEEFVFPYIFKIAKLGGMELYELDEFVRFCEQQTRELHEALLELETEAAKKEEGHAREI